MTGPAVQPADSGLPPLHRILTPDEFHQAKQLSPDALATSPFPLLPPAAPKDAVSTLNPNAPTDKGTPLTGLGRILTTYVAQPIMDHPLTMAAGALTPGAGYLFTGMMGKDILEYASQKAAEMTLPPDVKAEAEKDPTRIPGERAAVEAAMLGGGALVGAAAKAGRRPGGPSVQDVANAGGNERFSGLPVPAETKAVIAGHVDQITDSFNRMFSPASRTPEAGQAANILRATTGHAAGAYEQAAFKLDEFRRAIEPLPEADKLGFIDAIEGGKSQASPEFQKAADTMRKILDDARQQVQDLGTGKLEKFIENYFPHIWKDAERAGEAFKNAPEEAASTAKPVDPNALAPNGDFTQAHLDELMATQAAHGLRTIGPNEALKMSPAELRSYADQAKTAEKTMAASALDPETLKRFNAAERKANSSVASNEEIHAATNTMQEIEAKMTPRQRLLMYGDRRADYTSHQDAAEMASAAERVDPEVFKHDEATGNPISSEHLLSDVGRLVTTGNANLGHDIQHPAALIQLRGTVAELERRGMSMDEILKGALTERVRRGYAGPGDVTELARTTMEKLKSGGFFGEPAAAQRALPSGAAPAETPPSGSSSSDKSALKAARAATGGKRPMEGSKSFLKQRTIPTTAEGMAMGLEPVSTNPVDLTLLKLREMQRYVMAHQSLNEMKDAGLVTFVRAGEQRPDGYQPIDDRVATVFGPRQGAVNLPEMTPDSDLKPEDVGVPGMRIMGQYHAPEPVATLVNNYLSPGLRGNAIYDAYRGLGNTLNQAQLGLSAFHLGFTTLDATVSRAALGLEHIVSGKPLTGLADVVSAPAAGLSGIAQGTIGDLSNYLFKTDFQWGTGAKIRAAYLDPENASPQMAALANAVKEAGGRIRQDSFYANSAPEKMITAWKNDEYFKSAAYSIPALFETAAKPIMEHIVPLQKLGIFGDMAKKVMADLPDDAPLAARRDALGKVWDSVDNRMGQLVYDNLFWNKTLKDLAMGGVRSVGWNLGTMRELGGGMQDIAGAAKNVASGNPAELTHRAAYVMALPLTVGLYGAIYQYLRTGEGPSEFKDYYYPKTGDVDADGNPERVVLPSYMKDMFAYAGNPFGTLQHKVSPLLAATDEMLTNQNYYGDEIRNPHDPLVDQVKQSAEFLGKQMLPFSITNRQEMSMRGDQSQVTKLGTAVGVTPAPRNKVRSDAQNLMAEFQAEHRSSGSTPEQQDAAQTRSQIIAGLRGNKNVDVTTAVTEAINRHQLTAPDVVKLLKAAGTTPAQEKFKTLTLDQAVEVFKRSTDAEKAKFAEALLAKVNRASKSKALAENP